MATDEDIKTFGSRLRDAILYEGLDSAESERIEKLLPPDKKTE